MSWQPVPVSPTGKLPRCVGGEACQRPPVRSYETSSQRNSLEILQGVDGFPFSSSHLTSGSAVSAPSFYVLTQPPSNLRVSILSVLTFTGCFYPRTAPREFCLYLTFPRTQSVRPTSWVSSFKTILPCVFSNTTKPSGSRPELY